MLDRVLAKLSPGQRKVVRAACVVFIWGGTLAMAILTFSKCS